jgi:sulfoxide reductase catalytic subunit YedY
MILRRSFLKFLTKILGLLGFMEVSRSWGFAMSENKTQLTKVPKGTDLSTLVRSDPGALDTSELELTPLEEFQTMGLEDWDADIEDWRLRIAGSVEKTMELSYPQIMERPIVERDVLLICPGFFAQHGRWKGISVGALFREARLVGDVKWVTISGPEGRYKKTARFPISDAMIDKLFLAYEVNGQRLPQKHGFPLRLVNEGVLADDWVKYVDLVTADT